MPPLHPEPIRLIILDDIPAFGEGLGAVLTQTTEGEIVCVDMHTRNTPEFLERVRATKPDVILADLWLDQTLRESVALARPETSGLKAIQALRQSAGPALKINDSSVLSHHRDSALRHGADTFLSKTATVAEICQTIRHVMGRAPAPAADPHQLGRLTGLELFVAYRAFVLHGDRDTDLLPLDAAPFALLSYLARERQQKAQGWARWAGGPAAGQDESSYHMSAVDVWQSVNQACGGTFQRATIPTRNISQWAAKINAAVRPWRDHTGRALLLIDVPGAGNGGLAPRVYALASSITSEGIHIHPKAPGEATS